MKTAIKNFAASLIIIILFICAVHLPFSSKHQEIEISYPADTYFKKGLGFLSLNSLPPAVRAFKSAIVYQPSFAPFHYYLALVYEKQNKYEQALNEYHKVTEIDPEFYRAFYSLGKMLGNAKEYHSAITALRRAVQLNPYYVSAFNDLAKVYVEIGDPESAEKIYAYLKRLSLDE